MTAQTVAKKLGKNIAKYRKRMRLSQADLGGMIGVQQPYISKLELGKRNPTLSTIAELANALNITVPMLFDF